MRVIGGIAIVLALLLALQAGLAPALVQAQEELRAIVPINAAPDYSCSPGPTGDCYVYYVPHPVSVEKALQDCGESACKVRVEMRI